MQQFQIRSGADVRAIEAAPYAAFMAHGSVHDALEAVAARHPQRTAVSFVRTPDPATPAERWCYADLMARVRQAANLFASLAGADGPRVAMLLPNIPEAHLVLWGAETAGMVCPVNYMLDGAHVAELIGAAGCDILVALGPHLELDIWSKVADIARTCPRLRHVLAVGGAPAYPDFMAAVAAMPGEALRFEPPREPHRIAALFHTGGTTGTPKLARHTHGNQLHAAWGAARMYAMDEHDVILNGFPLFHVAGAFVYGLSTLLSGAELVLPTLTGLRNTAFMARYWSFVERHRVSLIAAVPTVISTLLGTERGQASLASVRALLTGGSPLPGELAAAFERQYGIPVRNILGMTECAGVVSIEPFLGERVPGSCGLALPFTEVRAVDEAGRPCPPGGSGIIRLRGPHVGPGYTDTRRNAGTFTDDGWLITGDIGHVDEAGRVFITGRAKDVIIRSGHNIDPQVLEEALLQHPDVLVAAAVGEPDEYAGELPVAFVSLREGARVEAGALRDFANARIPERPAYLKRVHILAAVPVTAVGKVYKPRLRALSCERALAERLAGAGLHGHVEVAVQETPRGIHVRFTGREEAAAEQHRSAVDALMRSFPYDYAFVPGGANVEGR